MKRKEYRIETIKNGVLCSQFCNNLTCAMAFCEMEFLKGYSYRIFDGNKILYIAINGENDF